MSRFGSDRFQSATVIVEPEIPEGFADVSEVTATVEDVMYPKTFVDSSGTLREGIYHKPQ